MVLAAAAECVPFQSQDVFVMQSPFLISSCMNCHCLVSEPECGIGVALWLSWCLAPLPRTRVLLLSRSAAVYHLEIEVWHWSLLG